ncbi:MAG TPA: hypothetical protein VG738_12235 [Chitinophagaceae bacterium]|nr:hypothetical protein [Chitinophagaceae bacterium]
MAFSANITATLNIGDDTYDISLAIPNGAPTPANPYTFTVEQTPKTGSPVTLLDLSVGDSTNYSLELTPPPAILQQTGVVETLTIKVADSSQ